MERYRMNTTTRLHLLGCLLISACAAAADREHVESHRESIINGDTVQADSLGVVFVQSSHGQCTGTLMTSAWVLTAGHCLTGVVDPSDVDVQHTASVGPVFETQGTLIIQDDHADAALVRLRDPVTVQGQALRQNNPLLLGSAVGLRGKMLDCYGYGNDGHNSPAGTLRRASLLVTTVTDNYITLSRTAGQFIGEGDSGGPCFYQEGNYRYQAGVIHNFDDATGLSMEVNTNAIRDWVDYNMAFADESLGGQFSSGGAIASYGPNTLELFGRGTDKGLWEKQWTGSAWTGWRNLHGTITSDPGAVYHSSTSALAFVRGTAHNVIVGQSSNKTWPSVDTWTSLGGNVTTDPTAVNTGDGNTWLFGRGTDNALWYRKQSNTGSWSGWASLGGYVGSDIAAVSADAGEIDLFYLAADNTVEHRYYTARGWSTGSSIDGTTFNSAPAATSAKTGQIDLFEINADGTIAYRKWYGKWASTWNNLGYSTTSNLAVTSWFPGRMDVIFRGPNNDMRHFYWGD
jgi:hypothetical protein